TYRLNNWLMFDVDYAASQAHFLEPDPDTGGTKVDQAIGVMASMGPTVRFADGFFANMKYRYLGPRNLLPDGSLSASAVNWFTLGAGYENMRLGCGFELLNAFNNNGHDAAYAVESSINGVDGITTSHPLEPFQARFYFTLKW